MGQAEILKLLKKKGPLTSREIAFLLKAKRNSITRGLRRLLKYNEIKARKITDEERKEKGYNKSYIHSRFKVFFCED